MVPFTPRMNVGRPTEPSLESEAIRAELKEPMIFLLDLASQTSLKMASFAPRVLSLMN